MKYPGRDGPKSPEFGFPGGKPPRRRRLRRFVDPASREANPPNPPRPGLCARFENGRLVFPSRQGLTGDPVC